MKTSEIIVCLTFGLGCLIFAVWPLYRRVVDVFGVFLEVMP